MVITGLLLSVTLLHGQLEVPFRVAGSIQASDALVQHQDGPVVIEIRSQASSELVAEFDLDAQKVYQVDIPVLDDEVFDSIVSSGDELNFQASLDGVDLPVQTGAGPVVVGDSGSALRLDITVLEDVATFFAPTASLGGDWYYSAWFGTFNAQNFPWVYHAEHGWLYVSGSSDSMWFYDVEIGGWLWTNKTEYPAMYHANLQQWVYYYVGTTAPRRFFVLTQPGYEITVPAAP